jgi:hypothetical protein
LEKISFKESAIDNNFSFGSEIYSITQAKPNVTKFRFLMIKLDISPFGDTEKSNEYSSKFFY